MTNPQDPNQLGGENVVKKGLFLVIEGTDGSGKTTQYNLLVERLVNAGYVIELIKFPQYDEESSYFVREYLAGNYGTAEEVGPYTGSMFYALDRYAGAKKIRNALDSGKIVIADRYIGANMAHQGQKFNNDEDRNGYFMWLEAIEYKMLSIPKPDINLVLRVPSEISTELIDKRNLTKDIHEKDPEHGQKALKVFDDMCRLFPDSFKPLDCVRNGQLMSIESIHGLIWETIQPLLPSKEAGTMKVSHKDKEVVERLDENEFIAKGKNGLEITTAGKAELAKYISNTEDNVYAFNEELSPVTIAAAMARLSRRSDDMRITILDEFLGKEGKDENLLKRVITAYGDDSVQQLVGQHVVVEGASNLLTKKLEWGRLASYLEQSTRYIYFDQKDKGGKYKYYVPEYLDKKTKALYVKSLDQIFEIYSKMVHELTDFVRAESSVPKEEQDIAWQGATRAQACDAIRTVLPVATKSTVGIFASGQALESLIMHLLADALPEAKETGQKMLDESRKVLDTFLERADKPDRGGAWQAYKAETHQSVAELADKYLPNSHSAVESAPVALTDVWPRNELDLIPNILYEHSQKSLKEIKAEVESWTYEKKTEVFEAFIGTRLNRRQRPGRALEKIHYSFDILCDYGIFRDLQRHRMVDDLNWQLLTPRFGYAIPELVEKAGLVDQFEQCFDISLKLYSILQEAGYHLEAQYATLLGHKMRWKITFNARQAFQMIELRSAPQGHAGYRKVAQEMHEKISEVHPLIGEAMKFVNQDEDPELGRLSAERYTQFKLNQK